MITSKEKFIINKIHHGESSIYDLTDLAHNEIKSINQSIDYFDSIDYWAYKETISKYLLEIKTKGSELKTAYPVCLKDKVNRFIMPEYSSLYKRLGYNLSLEQRNLLYYQGDNLKIFCDPVLVGFYSKDINVMTLGWGSAIIGSVIARELKPKLKLRGNIVCILTRHLSKYAHFIRDRMAKLLWVIRNIRDRNITHLVFDFELNKKEKEFIKALGINAEIIPAMNYKSIELTGNVIAFEVSSGMPLLNEIRYWSRENSTDKIKNINKFIYLDRGKNHRREISNINQVHKVLDLYQIPVMNIENLEIKDQLQILSNTDYVISPHGAQLINAISSKEGIIELLPFPYTLSGWGRTMLKMCYQCGIYYDWVLCKQKDFQLWEEQLLNKRSCLNTNELKKWQKQSIFVDTECLERRILSTI